MIKQLRHFIKIDETSEEYRGKLSKKYYCTACKKGYTELGTRTSGASRCPECHDAGTVVGYDHPYSKWDRGQNER